MSDVGKQTIKRSRVLTLRLEEDLDDALEDLLSREPAVRSRSELAWLLIRRGVDEIKAGDGQVPLPTRPRRDVLEIGARFDVLLDLMYDQLEEIAESEPGVAVRLAAETSIRLGGYADYESERTGITIHQAHSTAGG